MYLHYLVKIKQHISSLSIQQDSMPDHHAITQLNCYDTPLWIHPDAATQLITPQPQWIMTTVLNCCNIYFNLV